MYLSCADRLTDWLLHVPFGVQVTYRYAVATDLTVIDFLYETIDGRPDIAGSQLRQATLRLEEMTSIDHASAQLAELQTRLLPASCELLDVACATVAATTLLGYRSIVERFSQAHAERWLALWQRCMYRQDTQQEKHAGLCLMTRYSPLERRALMSALGIAESDMRPRGETFAAGVLDYLHDYADTGAAAVALVGALPFTEKVPHKSWTRLLAMMDEPQGILSVLTPMLRFAQDLPLDPSEPISTGVYAFAAKEHRRVIDVDHAEIPRAQVLAELAAEWDRYRIASTKELERMAASVTHAPTRAVIEELVRSAICVATALATGYHKA